MSVPAEQMQGQGGGLPGGDAMALFAESVKAASNILYDDRVFTRLVKAAQDGDVPNALAMTVVQVLGQVQANLGDLALDSLFALAMSMVADAADALQQVEVEVSADDVTLALETAITMYLQEHPDQFTDDEIQDGVNRLEAGIKEMPDEVGAEEQPAAPPQGGLLSGGM